MVHKHVAFGEHGEEVHGLVVGRGQAGLGHRGPGLVLEVGTVELVHGPQAPQVQGPVDGVEVGRLQLQLSQEQRAHLL